MVLPRNHRCGPGPGYILGGGPNNAQVMCRRMEGRTRGGFTTRLFHRPFRFQPPPPPSPSSGPCPLRSAGPHRSTSYNAFILSLFLPHTLTHLPHPPPTPTALPSSVSRQVSFSLRRLGYSVHRHTPPTQTHTTHNTHALSIDSSGKHLPLFLPTQSPP